MLKNEINLNFDVTTKGVRVTFLSTLDDIVIQRKHFENLSYHHNDLGCCPPTLKNLLVVRELLDLAIEEAVEKDNVVLQYSKSNYSKDTNDLKEQVIARWLASRDGSMIELVSRLPSNFYTCVFQGVALSIGPYDTLEEAIDDVQARVDSGQFDPLPANWVRLLAPGDPIPQLSDVEGDDG